MITLQQYANILVQNGILSADTNSWPNLNIMLDNIRMTEAKSASMTRPVGLNRNSLKVAIDFYCDVGSKIINGYFRTNKELQLNRYISECMRVLMYYSNSTVYAGGKTLYHGGNLDSFLSRYGLRWETMDSLKGKKIRIPGGFTSTSLAKNKAEAFSDNLVSGYPMLLKLNTPNSFNAIHRTMGSYVDEYEYILPPNTVIHVTSVDQDKFGRIIVTANIIGVNSNGKLLSAEANSKLFISKVQSESKVQSRNNNQSMNKMNSVNKTNGVNKPSTNTALLKEQILDKLVNSMTNTIQNKIGIKVLNVQSEQNRRSLVIGCVTDKSNNPIKIGLIFRQGDKTRFVANMQGYEGIIFSASHIVSDDLNDRKNLEIIKTAVVCVLEQIKKMKSENRLHAA